MKKFDQQEVFGKVARGIPFIYAFGAYVGYRAGQEAQIILDELLKPDHGLPVTTGQMSLVATFAVAWLAKGVATAGYYVCQECVPREQMTSLNLRTIDSGPAAGPS